MQISHQQGITAQWQSLVSEAEQFNGVQLEPNHESYLVHTLVRYTSNTEMVKRIMALEYLNAMQHPGSQRQDELRDVGDQCLLFAGLFPMRARRRQVKVSYYVELGRSAYQVIGDSEHDWSDIYAEMATEFVTLMDTLHAIRKLGNNHELDAMGAYELMMDSNSQQARTDLEKTTSGQPIMIKNNFKH